MATVRSDTVTVALFTVFTPSPVIPTASNCTSSPGSAVDAPVSPTAGVLSAIPGASATETVCVTPVVAPVAIIPAEVVTPAAVTPEAVSDTVIPSPRARFATSPAST